jgi:polyphosphate kinase
MRRSKTAPVEIDLSHPQYYFNREMSWLEFNNRVLHEAFDPRTRLLERLKFLAIFSSNLDEYFMVRVAALKEQVAAQVSKLSYDGKTAQAQLEMIHQRLRPMVIKQHRHFRQAICPQLTAQGVHLLNYIDLNPTQQTYLQQYFEAQVFPVLTPLAIDPSHPFPYISNLSLNLAVVVQDPITGADLFARVKVPNVLPRFIPLPPQNQGTDHSKGRQSIWVGVPLEQVIAHNLDLLFPGLVIQAYHPFRITRNADLDLDEDEAEDLMLAIEQELHKRRVGGSVVRMEINPTMPEDIRTLLMEEFGLTPYDVYAVEGPLGLRDLLALMTLPLPKLKDPAWTPVVPPRLKRVNERDIEDPPTDLDTDFFAIVRKQDLLLHHPYDSFTGSVQRFIAEAAHDPDVLAIKITLYRTSGDSPIVEALITAAEKGKQVVALVELKARFDEENNINWARQLESAGVHVVYGLVGLKTHTKLVLVVRREAERIRRYVHIGTGNYNPKTARLYTDVGLLSCRDDLGADLTDLFNYLTGYSRQQTYRQLVLAPMNLRDRMIALIQREIDHQQQGAHSRIVAKMNALVDPQIIAALYAASQAGVQIDLIVRGICCLRPGLPGVSDNIRVISIVGRFLEHSRIFYFHNRGQEEILIGSADLMPRNLDRRVEALVPITDPVILKDLQEICGLMLADNRYAWELKPTGRYVQRRPVSHHPDQSCQNLFMEIAQSPTGG